ncbi:FAD-dependent oxidoreductase [Falsirhodobacter algicola]|uniref:FAD-dependent oxidoreductase n=1 Tax=Falsirhodobacter algicola TaxID=2692330 RepID=A0A8J8MUL4_9RHOB|nr:FAD-dependent oxidoreductase [Falsirhodobacter algicola]QUS37022.1 FAD-dependent oxidoreductase [Falsirhodobacter algicola]
MQGKAAGIVLLGAGHANLLAVRPLRAALPQARITLVDMAGHATYSGMFPGHAAGHYPAGALRVDLTDFADRHGIAFRRAEIMDLDPATRRVCLSGGDMLEYDVAALDIGSHGAMPELPGFAAHAVAVKPMGPLAARLAAGPAAGPAVVIGGGVAGAEMALALSHRGHRPVTILEAAPVFAPGLRPRTRACLHRAFARAGIRLCLDARAARIEAEAVVLASGARIASALTLGVAGARAHGWPARGLPVDAGGFVRVDPYLQVEGHPGLFAVGDCAAMMHAPRPKAGVFAVRQAPVLAQNLAAAHDGRRLRRFDPQRDYLKIIALGGRSGLAEWRGITLHGPWLWRLKDGIDRRFMRGLQGAGQPRS